MLSNMDDALTERCNVDQERSGCRGDREQADGLFYERNESILFIFNYQGVNLHERVLLIKPTELTFMTIRYHHNHSSDGSVNPVIQQCRSQEDKEVIRSDMPFKLERVMKEPFK